MSVDVDDGSTQCQRCCRRDFDIARRFERNLRRLEQQAARRANRTGAASALNRDAVATFVLERNPLLFDGKALAIVNSSCTSLSSRRQTSACVPIEYGSVEHR